MKQGRREGGGYAVMGRENDSGVVGGRQSLLRIGCQRRGGRGRCDGMVWEDLAEMMVVVTVMRRRESRG